MKDVTEMMLYDMAFRIRLYIASKFFEEQRRNDLSEREALILELIATKGSMSISEISNFYPKASNSTISTTITKLWKDKKLVDKRIYPANQRITTVNLTEKGRDVLEQLKKKQTDVYSIVTASLALSSDQTESFHQVLKNAIGFFNEMLDLELDQKNALGA